jgi:photosystem II stability/assembly factor-like uncharacterized protein
MASSDHAPSWQVQYTGVESNLRGVSVTSESGVTDSGVTDNDKHNYIVWVTGSKRTILRSTEEGKTWTQLTIPGGADLDFRGIKAFGADTAYVMSSGDGDKSRIYKTADGGKTWTLQYSDKRPGFFLDSLACDSKTHCLALSDPVDGKFLVLSTADGEHWTELPRDKMPAALPKEGGFAASNTSIAICGLGDDIYFGSGGAQTARVFHSADAGRSWSAVDTPVASGNAASGIFSIACHGSVVVAVGGDYKEPSAASHVAAYSTDSGVTWHLAEGQPGGYRSALGQFSHGDFIAVGPNGTDISHGEPIHMMHWKHADNLNLNAVSFDGSSGWGVGPKGTIARWQP